MRLSFQRIVSGFVYFVGLLTIARVLLLLSYSKSHSTNVRKLLAMQSRVRDIYSYSRDEKYEDESWKDWHKHRFMNDRLFLSSFEKLHTDLSLSKYRTEELQFVLCVFSSPSNGERRRGARETWANSSLMPVQNTALWFILGRSRSSRVNRKVLKEKEEFGDIIVGNFRDHNGNNTLKVLFSLYFVITSYPSVKEIYFGFDLTYVHLQHLWKKLMFRDNSGIGQWRGYVMKRMKPERDKANPFYVSESLFNDSVYPTFCKLHNGFTLSSSLGKQILFIARNETLFVFPDVFLGMVAAKANLEIVKDVSFGSQVYRPNLRLCQVRSSMTAFTFIGDPVESWKILTNVAQMRKCFIPDVDAVLPKMTDNRPYFNQVLKYLNNNETICSTPSGSHDGGTFIVALISSFVGNFEQRLAIRETWGSRDRFYGRVVRIVFVLSKPTTREKHVVQAKVNKESKKYGDIIQGNFHESFQNLTLKVVLGLKWVSEFCADAAYLYKGDEDMFVAWSRIVMLLLRTSDRKGSSVMKRFFLGVSMMGSGRITDSKNRYYVNESIYHGNFYPRYCSGGSYLLSTDIIPELYRRSLVTPLIPIDDAYQGILTQQIGVYPINNRGFKVGFKKTKCILQDPETHTLHGFKTGESLRHVWYRYIHKKECLYDP